MTTEEKQQAILAQFKNQLGTFMPEFRAWNEKSKCMFYEVNVDRFGHASDGISYLTYDRPPDAVMQFSGYLDKNKKKIFAGDIILRQGHKRVIVMKDGGFCCFPIKHWTEEPSIDYLTAMHHGWFLANFMPNIEVIGNVYETPEKLFE